MAIDSTQLGQLAAHFMESIERDFGQDAELGVVSIVAEINVYKADGPGYTSINFVCTDNRRWIQAALFDAGQRCVYAGIPGAADD